MSALAFYDICFRLQACCEIQDGARPHIDPTDGTHDLYQAMTLNEMERVKRHLDIAGGPLAGYIIEEGTMNQRIALLIAFYMFEVRKVDWSTLCIHADVWDEIKRQMQYNKDVYYRSDSFSGQNLVHNINALFDLMKASRVDRKTFKAQFLLFKLSLV